MQGLSDLLATFDLYLPFREVLTGVSGNSLSSRTTPLAHKLRTTSGTHVRTTDVISALDSDSDSDSGSDDDLAILDIPRSTFKLPYGVESQFRRFMAEWHVTARKVSRLESLDGERVKHRRPEAPRWMLVHKLNQAPNW